MSESYIWLDAPDGSQVRMPVVQALTLARLAVDLVSPVWHFNQCGCCVSLHERDDNVRGYIIGADGGADWVEAWPQ